MRYPIVCCLCLVLCGCQSRVMQKVKYDFGIGEKPEGYVSASDRVWERLEKVGETEMTRMNVEGRHGEVKFDEEDSLHGKYYKECKVYEKSYPLDVQPVSRGSTGERGFVGLVEYSYRVYQSARVSSRTEAGAEAANVATDVTGKETFRYNFAANGVWDGAEGERAGD